MSERKNYIKLDADAAEEFAETLEKMSEEIRLRLAAQVLVLQMVREVWDAQVRFIHTDVIIIFSKHTDRILLPWSVAAQLASLVRQAAVAARSRLSFVIKPRNM